MRRYTAILPLFALALSNTAFGYVTSDAFGTHTTTPGVSAFGVNVDGVAKISFVTARGTLTGTGALLSDGIHILTAGHAVANTGGVEDATSATITFTTPAGAVITTSTSFTVDPLYNGNSTEGNDLALINLSSPLDPAIPRYSLYTGHAEIGATSAIETVKVGYGSTGYGATGDTVHPAGKVNLDFQKRAGLNNYVIDGYDLLNAMGQGINPFGGHLPLPGLTIAYAFDSITDYNNHTTDNNPLSFYLTAQNFYGYGPDEVGAAPGDSGGPTFINANGTWEIAGVTSYGFGLRTNPPDVTPGNTDSSWGEVMVDQRVSGYTNTGGFLAAFAAAPATVPEPGTLAITALGAIGLIAKRTRRQTAKFIH